MTGDDSRSRSRSDTIGLAVGSGVVGGAIGVLVAIAIWLLLIDGSDSGAGTLLLGLSVVLAICCAALTAAGSIAWYRRWSDD